MKTRGKASERDVGGGTAQGSERAMSQEEETVEGVIRDPCAQI